ncbi:MAG: Family 2 glycosyl transferase [Candidatus Berkelbacteria bacterium Licking1014_7]|uniref:Beta-monoglucosyldiacylglycerol synthase n=1 Tax=Candidatus Berkelbacteria bacterium Licking1014_7 TaxID=2017147 RepID=A0A554LHS2_9BACT|nr:MAG: Family 2 glycosyl transferase [Candidatus Berkelbacteria bacterium Licking1014_7]
MILILFFLLILVASAFAPQYVVIFLVLNLLIGLFLSIFQIIIALLPNLKIKRGRIKTQPFVSILIPSYNEPPVILIQTLDMLSQLDYDRFEVLVIDNNTKDPNIWNPVKSFIKTLGQRFRFFHIDNLSGFKAGALNYILNYTNPQSEYAAVIDADYVVKNDFLKIALAYFTDNKTALVQFPQRYRNLTPENEPIIDEYQHFFGIYMNMANRLDCVPSTGTVSIYKLSVLRQIGGFRIEALTEDADVGLRIYGAGYHGLYIDQSVGYGLMPYDLEAYRKQKWRWAFGNAQSLKTLFLLFPKISFRSWIGFLSHLTAWHHFNFLSFAALAAFPVILYTAIPITDYHKRVLIFASLTIFITLMAKMLLFLATLRKQKKFLVRALRAFIIHMGLTLVYSEAWIVCLFGKKYAFERTNKFVLRKMPSLLKNSYSELLLGSWFLVNAVTVAYYGYAMIMIAFLISAAVLFSIYYVYWKIAPTKECSKKIILELEKKYQSFIQKNAENIHAGD